MLSGVSAARSDRRSDIVCSFLPSLLLINIARSRERPWRLRHAPLTASARYTLILTAHRNPTRLLRRAIILARIHESLLDIACQAVERFLNIDVRFRGDLHEGYSELICEGLALFGGDLALLLPVAFVADEDLVYAFAGVLFDVGEPGSYVWGDMLIAQFRCDWGSVGGTSLTIETLLICNIVYQQYAHRSSVIRRCDCSEAFLARGIPYL